MTRRYVLKQIKVRDSNGQACVAYREVTPIAEYGRWAYLAFSYGCLAIVLAVVIAVIMTN